MLGYIDWLHLFDDDRVLACFKSSTFLIAAYEIDLSVHELKAFLWVVIKNNCLHETSIHDAIVKQLNTDAVPL